MSLYEPRPEGLNTQPAPPSVVETIAEDSNHNPPPPYAKPAPPPPPPATVALVPVCREFPTCCRPQLNAARLDSSMGGIPALANFFA
ncbi:hypothetical protein [Pandoraea sp. ISTKB]|uniref:hypothetical protein n=1 Tax=Pandoraea sp. ISTKB TaxID=1586708 RepID=UPI001113023E|nr:hypothetical protein [Pandoraea sp. ISTKB]